MHYDIQEYNKEALSSEKQMLLFNIGELHYKQPPHFMMLSSIAQTRSFSAGASFQWSQVLNALTPTTMFESMFTTKKGTTITKTTTGPTPIAEGSTWEAGPFTAATSESPTFQFVPLQGQDFAQRFESSLTDKFTLFLEDQRWSSRAPQNEALVMLFAQSLFLWHGETDGRPCSPGLLRNDGHTTFSQCVDEIVTSEPYYELIDSGYPVPTGSSEGPKAVDLVPALAAGYEFPKDGDKGMLTKPIKIPAWFDYNPDFVAAPKPKPKSSEPLPPVWSQKREPKWRQNTAYFLPKDYKWKEYLVNIDPKKSAQHIYALVPDGYDLARDENGYLRRDAQRHYIPKKSREVIHSAIGRWTKGSPTITETKKLDLEDVGSPIGGPGIPSGTTILAVNASMRKATMSHNADRDSAGTMSVGDVDRFFDRFSYGDEVVSDVWPVPQDYFYVELRKGEVDDATAKDLCHSQTDKIDPANPVNNNLVCGYFKIGNLLQIMQRLAEMACTYQDKKDIEQNCSQSIFGIGTSVPSWAENSAPYRHRVGPSNLQTE